MRAPVVIGYPNARSVLPKLRCSALLIEDKGSMGRGFADSGEKRTVTTKGSGARLPVSSYIATNDSIGTYERFMYCITAAPHLEKDGAHTECG